MLMRGGEIQISGFGNLRLRPYFSEYGYITRIRFLTKIERSNKSEIIKSLNISIASDSI